MQALQALSEVNIKISEARNLLLELQEKETEFIVLREKKVLKRIDEVIKESQNLLSIVDQNYKHISEITVGIADFNEKIGRLSAEYTSLIAEFEAENEEWERRIGRQLDDIATQKQNLKILEAFLQNQREGIQQEREKLVEDQKILHKDRQSLKNAIIRLKKGKI